MLASPRLEAGVRALFSYMLGFENIQTLQKDPIIYPAFSLDAADDAREQTRTVLDLDDVASRSDQTVHILDGAVPLCSEPGELGRP